MVRPAELYDLTDEKLLERMGQANPDSTLTSAVRFEFERRALIAMRDAARAQIDASDASKRAAEANITAADAAKQTATWTRVSALAIAASVLVMAIAPYLGKG